MKVILGFENIVHGIGWEEPLQDNHSADFHENSSKFPCGPSEALFLSIPARERYADILVIAEKRDRFCVLPGFEERVGAFCNLQLCLSLRFAILTHLFDARARVAFAFCSSTRTSRTYLVHCTQTVVTFWKLAQHNLKVLLSILVLGIPVNAESRSVSVNV